METIQSLMTWLNQVFSFVNTSGFYVLFTVSAFVNPVAVLMQTYRSWRARSLDGLSLPFFCLMAYLQGITVFYGIRFMEPAITLVMLLSLIGTIGTIMAIIVRRRLT